MQGDAAVRWLLLRDENGLMSTKFPLPLVILLLLGIGVDTSVHVIHRASGQPADAPLVASGLGRALVYSGLTSVVGFGSLVLADHAGTASIGVTISLGVLSSARASSVLNAPASRTRRAMSWAYWEPKSRIAITSW